MEEELDDAASDNASVFAGTPATSGSEEMAGDGAEVEEEGEVGGEEADAVAVECPVCSKPCPAEVCVQVCACVWVGVV